MIVLLFAFLYVMIINSTYGWVFSKVIGKFTGYQNQRFVIIQLLGLVGITTIASFSSLLFRINWEFQLALLIVGIVIIFVWKPYQDLHFPNFNFKSLSDWANAFMIIISLVIVLNATTLTPANSDTSIYHAQAIHWIEEFPAIPGLANLHTRLGYNSSWLLLNAVFSFSFLGLGSLHFMTGFLFTVAVLFFASGIRNILEGRIRISDLLKLIFLVSLFVFLIDQASSPGTDAPAAIIVWILITEIVYMIEEGSTLRSPNMVYLSIISVFALTIKLSVFPLILFAVPIVIAQFRVKNPRILFGVIIASLLILIPYIIRNLILTGYFVYPGPEVDLFKFDWRVPASWLGREVREIHWFAALPRVDQSEFYSMPAKQWVPIWFFNQIPRHQAMLGAILLIPILIVILSVFKKWRVYLSENKLLSFPLSIAYIGSIYWFLSAPAIRFGYGFLLADVSLGIAILIFFLFAGRSRLQTKVRYGIVPIILTGVILFSRTGYNLGEIQNRILLQVNYPSWSSQPCVFGNFTILCQAGYDACWYEPFPCAIQGNENVEMRGKDFRQGFRNLEN